jgi:hypothetical protein
MLTKYVGKADLICVEYNGKKYCFSKKTPIKDVPTEVYNYLQRSNGLHIEDVIPHHEPVVSNEPKTEAPKPIIEEPKEAKRGRPKKGE